MSDTRRWYREPWVWLLISLPMTAVIAGMVTIYLAVSTSDGLVVDDYYKRGKAINVDLARDAAAARHELRADIDLDMRNNHVQLLLQGNIEPLPETLTLSLLHPTQAGYDQLLSLQHAGDGVYSGAIDEVGRGNWYLQLETVEWRLSGSMRMPHTGKVVLLPQEMTGQ
jgi:hypothetical protein